MEGVSKMFFKTYKSVVNSLDMATKWLAIISTASLVVVMILNVLFRYFLKLPLIWADEVSLYLFAWCTFLGASLGIRNNTMAAVTIIIDYLPKPILKYVQIAIQVLVISFAVIVAIVSSKWVLSPSTINTISPSSQLPMWVPFIILPIGLFLITVFSIDNIVNILLKKTAENENSIEEAS